MKKTYIFAFWLGNLWKLFLIIENAVVRHQLQYTIMYMHGIVCVCVPVHHINFQLLNQVRSKKQTDTHTQIHKLQISDDSRQEKKKRQT